MDKAIPYGQSLWTKQFLMDRAYGQSKCLMDRAYGQTNSLLTELMDKVYFLWTELMDKAISYGQSLWTRQFLMDRATCNRPLRSAEYLPGNCS